MVHSSLEVPVPKGKIHLMVVSEEWRPDDGDDLMVLLALNHATRGILPPFGFAPGARREMSPEEIRDWTGAHEDAPVVVVLSASPPTVEERRAMDEAYLRATSPEGMADVREGRAALPERYSDDWLTEVGPKCAAAIEAALAQRRELAILRSVGAGAGTVLSLLLAEGALVMLAGCVLGVVCLWALSLGAGPQIAAHFGILLPGTPLTLAEVRWLGWVIAGGAAASLLPGWRAYRLSLADGLTPRV